MKITACIGLGANIGDRARNIQLAIDQLAQTDGIRVMAVSNLLENPAVGGPADSPPFLNAAATVETQLSAKDLLHALLSIERSLGRNRRQKWEPRPIDLDLLLYGNEIIRSESLTVPHPLMHERRFVLQPLAEIAPQYLHPVLSKSVSELLDAL